jgi:hypothetical protein
MELDHEVVDRVQDKAALVEVAARERVLVVGVSAQHAEQRYRIKGAFPVSKRPVLNAVQR